MTAKLSREIIDRIFKEPGIKYELTEFENLGKPINEILRFTLKLRKQAVMPVRLNII